jgi:hypothetical protein
MSFEGHHHLLARHGNCFHRERQVAAVKYVFQIGPYPTRNQKGVHSLLPEVILGWNAG